MELKADIHLHLHDHGNDTDREQIEKLDQILEAIQLFKEQIMSAISNLQDAVSNENSVIASVVTLLEGLKAALDAAGTDQAALNALSEDIQAKTKTMADAVVANTPAAVPPAPAA